MLRCIKRIVTKYRLRNSLAKSQDNSSQSNPESISTSISNNVNCLRDILGSSSDVIIREFTFGNSGRTKAALILIDGLANKELIDIAILQPLLFELDHQPKQSGFPPDMDSIGKALVSSSDVKRLSKMDQLTDEILSGNTVLLVDGITEALSISAIKIDKRVIGEPSTENVVRGPREGFIESLSTNMSMIRRKIKSTGLRFETLKIGRQTQTKVCIAYLNGIVKPGLVDEIKRRLNAVQTDSVLDSGYIEAFIEEAPYSIFATVGSSERPDAVAGKILEGRAAILVDGSPFVLTVPLLFIESFQTAEDYYIRSYYASGLRFIRVFAYIISILAPAAYVALSTYHQELIPTQLLFTMAAGHEGIPFPSVLEAILMIVLFDILKEAGVRLPKPVGSAISIVGALVLGESAVAAGLVGPFMVIVVAITAISSFAVPSLADSASVLRYFLLLAAGFLGGFGIVMGLLIILIHLTSLSSYDVPYLSPIAPFVRKEAKDTLVRAPLLSMVFRPDALAANNIKRRDTQQQENPKRQD